MKMGHIVGRSTIGYYRYENNYEVLFGGTMPLTYVAAVVRETSHYHCEICGIRIEK